MSGVLGSHYDRRAVNRRSTDAERRRFEAGTNTHIDELALIYKSLQAVASATADWVMLIWLADDGIFSNDGAIVVAAIITHYALDLLLVRGIRRTSSAAAHTPAAAARIA